MIIFLDILNSQLVEFPDVEHMDTEASLVVQ